MYSLTNHKISGELESCSNFWMYPPLRTSLLVAIHDDIKNTSIAASFSGIQFLTSFLACGNFRILRDPVMECAQLIFPEFHFETEAKVDFPSACM